jgi:rSAM/selenodomain-associated transferase 1
MTTRHIGRKDRRGFQVVVMAKEPLAGAVKTRLCPPLSYDQAAALARAALLDTMNAVSASGARHRVLALEGRPGAWCRSGFDVIAQRGGDFGVRLAGAIDDAWARAPIPVLVIGMDTPQVQGPDLDRAVEPMLRAPTTNGDPPVAVLGPAEDGGYWAIGVGCPIAGLFDGVPMSTNRTYAAQLERLGALGVSCTVIDGLRDVDEMADALVVAEVAPATRFAAVLKPMVRALAVAGTTTVAPRADQIDETLLGRRD